MPAMAALLRVWWGFGASWTAGESGTLLAGATLPVGVTVTAVELSESVEPLAKTCVREATAEDPVGKTEKLLDAEVPADCDR